jgi:energy-coupling factor transport system ATP-binding protein
MFNGLLKPEAGSVIVDGVDIWEKPKEMRKVRFKVGLVMQFPEYQLFAETIYKDIAFGPQNMGLNEKEIDERVREAARFAGIGDELLEKSPFDLSGGQKRRAAIAGIIAMRPDILILDEPAAGLDPRGRDSIFKNIVDYQRKCGNTVIIVSHSMEDMAKFCDDLIVMSGGKVLLEGSCDEVFSSSDVLESVGLDIPQITKLMLKVKAAGIDVDAGIYTVDKAFDELLKLYKK